MKGVMSVGIMYLLSLNPLASLNNVLNVKPSRTKIQILLGGPECSVV